MNLMELVKILMGWMIDLDFQSYLLIHYLADPPEVVRNLYLFDQLLRFFDVVSFKMKIKFQIKILKIFTKKWSLTVKKRHASIISST
jgi:hypothetical protein